MLRRIIGGAGVAVGDATHSPAIIYDSYGRILSVVSTLISGTAPGGAAGGDLGGTYPNPTVNGFAAWTGYTPVITQSGTPTFTNNYAKSTTLGKLRIVSVALALTGAGTANNTIKVSLPAGASNCAANQMVGAAQIKLAGVSYGQCGCRIDTAGAATIHFVRGDAPITNVMGIDPNAALANLDTISFTVVYELA